MMQEKDPLIELFSINALPEKERMRRLYLQKKKAEDYQTNPVKWLVERFGEPLTTYQWSAWGGPYKDHQWDGTPEPFLEVFKSLARKEWVGIESATSTGKTYILPRVICWFLDVFPNSLVVTTAPKKDQLKTVLWTEIAATFNKFRKIRPNASMKTLRLAVNGAPIGSDESFEDVGHEAIGFVSGVGAGEESATKMQGFHREHMLFVLEEAAGINMAVINAIMNTSTAENNLVIAVGNPDSQVDSLHQFCELSKTNHIIISAYDHPNVVLQKTVIPGAVTQSSIDFRKEEYGEESNFYKSRVRGIAPKQGANSLIMYDWIEEAIQDGKYYHNNEILEHPQAIGIDVANSQNGDEAAYAYGRGNRLEILKEFPCPNATHLAYNFIFDNEYPLPKELVQKDVKYHDYGTIKARQMGIDDCYIGIDGVGVGAATVNAFKDQSWEVISLTGGQEKDFILKDEETDKLLYEFQSLRSQMYWELREDLRNREITIAINDPKKLKQLKKELVLIQYEIRTGKIMVERKDDIKKRLGGKSPNLADAFVYWNWMRKGYYAKSSAPLPFL